MTELVEGGATGADMLAKQWAQARGIPVKTFHAEWRKHEGCFCKSSDGPCRGAGPRRNAQMGDYADRLVAFRRGQTIGTLNMIDQMVRRRKPVHECQHDQALDSLLRDVARVKQYTVRRA